MYNTNTGGFDLKISKKDALGWFEFFAELPEEEELLTKQQEIVYAVFARINMVSSQLSSKNGLDKSSPYIHSIPERIFDMLGQTTLVARREVLTSAFLIASILSQRLIHVNDFFCFFLNKFDNTVDINTSCIKSNGIISSCQR